MPPLEALWWGKEGEGVPLSSEKKDWFWTAMIMQSDWITRETMAIAAEEVCIKKSLPAFNLVRCEVLKEGRVVQIMHIGPYDAEGPVLERLYHEFLPQNGLVCHGKHHEIDLSDPRRTTAEKLKTILRQPVRKVRTGSAPDNLLCN